jgi:hypothetical protein
MSRVVAHTTRHKQTTPTPFVRQTTQKLVYLETFVLVLSDLLAAGDVALVARDGVSISDGEWVIRCAGC